MQTPFLPAPTAWHVLTGSFRTVRFAVPSSPLTFLYKKLFEDPFWNLVRRQPKLFQNGDVLDIGANIGYTSAVFAGALKPDSKVYAFEPDQLSYGLLEEVIRRKKLSGAIEAINIGWAIPMATLSFGTTKRIRPTTAL